MCESSVGKTFAREENTSDFELGFKRKCIWQFSRNFAFTKVFIFTKFLAKTAKSFRFREIFSETPSVYGKKLRNQIKYLQKQLIFSFFRTFAPILRIFSLIILGKHIFMRKFSGKQTFPYILQIIFTKNENDFRETLGENAKTKIFVLSLLWTQEKLRWRFTVFLNKLLQRQRYFSSLTKLIWFPYAKKRTAL